MMEIGLPGACDHCGPEWHGRALSPNENACARISMMARSTTRSKQRQDTLMQDRTCRIEETSCNARPDHTFGSMSLVLGQFAERLLTQRKTRHSPTAALGQ